MLYVAETYCSPSWYGCKNGPSKLERFDEKEYTIEECFYECKAYIGCSSFMLSVGTINSGVCSLYADGCNHDETLRPWYPMYLLADCDKDRKFIKG